LAADIIQNGGCLLSEYFPGTQPLRHHFLERNRLIAGLAQATVVIQAGHRSGSLVTAQHALDENREVFVTEGEKGNPLWIGSAQLIEQGATILGDDLTALMQCCTISKQNVLQETMPREVDVDQFLKDFNFGFLDLIKLESKGVITILPGHRVLVHPERISEMASDSTG